MKIKDIFVKPIDRQIESVIKADDDKYLLQEVEEYVVTDGIRVALGELLESYNNNRSAANGVWISGFFGSGKSHLLKMLSMLLENKELDDKKMIDLFLDKLSKDDVFCLAEMKKAVALKSKSILFNIDQKADTITNKNDDALLSVFVKVFNEFCGYYGSQGHISKFERDLDEDGHFEEFKKEFNRLSGRKWEDGRIKVLRYSSYIDEAFNTVTGQSQSDVIDKYRADYKLSIEDFAHQVNSYIESQEKGFRLNFFVDEVGQFIADNVKLMTNLQTVVESLATICNGRAWCFVTSQGDMNTVLGALGKQQSNDFSKIMARFESKIKLDSKDVAEVIKKRLLEKKFEAEEKLCGLYHSHKNNFGTLFKFSDGSRDYRIFSEVEDFTQTYPFVPYQFDLFQTCIQNLSEQNAFEGKFSSVGERSMISIFQFSAKKLLDKELNSIATFDYMYEGIKSMLKTQSQSPVLTGERNINSELAVRLLKVLFLVKYVKEFKATARNLKILMYDNYTQDSSELINNVQTALNLLEQNSYITRDGENYAFLTNEEKDIEQEIKNTDVDNKDIINMLGERIFTNILRDRKIKYEENGKDYSFRKVIDGTIIGNTSAELTINIITPLNELSGEIETIKSQSIGKRDELFVVMPADGKLYRELSLYLKTEKYIRLNIKSNQSDIVRRILSDKRQSLSNKEALLMDSIKELICNSKFIINAKELSIESNNPEELIKKAFNLLLATAYINLKMLGKKVYKEEDLSSILNDDELIETINESEQEMLNTLKSKKDEGIRITLKKVQEIFGIKPYGWDIISIACIIAKLYSKGKIEIRLDSEVLDEKRINDELLNTRQYTNLNIILLEGFNASQVNDLKNFYNDFFDKPVGSTDAKMIGKETENSFDELIQEIKDLIIKCDNYPFYSSLKEAFNTIKKYEKKGFNYYIVNLDEYKDKLMDLKEDVIDPIKKFWNGEQKNIFDEAKEFMNDQRDNFEFIDIDGLDEIRNIFEDSQCYSGGKMVKIKDFIDKLKDLIKFEVKKTKKETSDSLKELEQKLRSNNQFAALSDDLKQEQLEQFEKVNSKINSLHSIPVIKQSLQSFVNNDYHEILRKVSSYSQKKDSNNDGVAIQKEQKKFVNISSLKVNIDKLYLDNEKDIDEYLLKMRKILIKEIETNKRIQI